MKLTPLQRVKTYHLPKHHVIVFHRMRKIWEIRASYISLMLAQSRLKSISVQTDNSHVYISHGTIDEVNERFTGLDEHFNQLAK